MKKASLVLVVVSLLITIGSPVYAGDFAFALAQNTTLSPGTREVSRPSAESFVSTLAREEEDNRKTGGVITTGLGIVLLGVGASYSNDNPEDEKDTKTACYISGGLFTALGVYSLTVPSYVEKEYGRINKIEDTNKREEASYAVLLNVAENARIARLSSAAFSGAMFLYCLTGDASEELKHDELEERNLYNALVSGALCVYSLLVETTPEKMLKEYQEGQRASRSNSAFAILPKLDGTITAVYTYNF